VGAAQPLGRDALGDEQLTGALNCSQVVHSHSRDSLVPSLGPLDEEDVAESLPWDWMAREGRGGPGPRP